MFARPAAPRFASVYMGRGIDQTFFIWCLVWWPYAIAHHLNPFITKLIFAPRGFNLTWATSIPLLSFLAFPLTAAIGPIATFNVICVLLPAMAAWCAFLLCRHLKCGFCASIVGGYVFGFSAYMLGHLLAGHLSLCAIFLVPLVVLVVIVRLEEHISRRAFAIALLTLLVAQFLISTEILATMTLFGGVALAGAWAIGPQDLRRRIVALAGPTSVAYLGTAVLMSPYLYYVFAGFRPVPLYSPTTYSANLLNLVVPTATVELGNTVGLFGRISAGFTANISEQGAYIGLPMLAVVGWFVVAHRERLPARLLALMLLVTLAAAMGPRFHLAGRASFKLPWSLFHRAPLLDQALPVRFTMYSFLILGIVLAMWLSARQPAPWVRLGTALLILASLFPNPATRFWADPARRAPPAFFTGGRYRHYLAPHETVAMLPYAWGESEYCMLWQAISGMYFRLAGGYFPLTPPAYQRWPAIRSSVENVSLMDPTVQWKAFAANHGVTMAVFAGAPPEIYARQLKSILPALGSPAAVTGGIELFRLSARMLEPYRGLRSVAMETLEDNQRFDALLIAARDYLAAGANPNGLSPENAARMGLLPPRLLATHTHNADYKVSLRVDHNGLIRIGIGGTYAAVHALADRYRADALKVYYPFPFRFGDVRVPVDSAVYRRLVMVFDRNGLERAAATVLQDPPHLRLNPISLPTHTTAKALASQRPEGWQPNSSAGTMRPSP